MTTFPPSASERDACSRRALRVGDDRIDVFGPKRAFPTPAACGCFPPFVTCAENGLAFRIPYFSLT